jgi:uncharacterized protein (DUF983 family)
MSDSPPVIVDAQGKPARKAMPKDDRCPQCGKGPDKRVASGGFGKPPHPICSACGYEWHDEVFGG